MEAPGKSKFDRSWLSAGRTAGPLLHAICELLGQVLYLHRREVPRTVGEGRLCLRYRPCERVSLASTYIACECHQLRQEPSLAAAGHAQAGSCAAIDVV